ncbi:peptidoglycan-binding protein [Sphaerisporangium krabiense]|uniref:Peptidoglycan hydrolase-like protein with peptidoglycan-binding domain n=1 Tax=Sphaerisporangium krabiense TaxID=763782 RepID=A0A7W8Z9X4_9ACTN|nr:peptidoglycan-binding domain-containing protein [Sphaerisporangium krabiense]MBB5630109.1 peptidoglycan hydrolase-like protein with peptidoglycan-binding domain [Sphaerisporangium krabiense]GII65057.1 peptidoglycan-binding protein [Sphaerisporangium krabiense]
MARTVTIIVAGVAVLAAAGAGRVLLTAEPRAAATPPVPTGTAPVARADVAQRRQVNGTVSYDGAYTVTGRGGVLTRLPAIGERVTRGRAVYEADGRRVPLLYGARPAWRPFALGMTTGADVLQLERNLRALGYTGFTVDRRYDLGTYYAVRRWQHDARLPVTGTVPLGQVIFLPRALRVTGHDARIGDTAAGPILHGSSAVPVVSVSLDPTMAPTVRRGDEVIVTLPDGGTRPGTVARVSTVAQTVPESQGDGQSQSAVPVTITLKGKPVKALDQALVQVDITVERRRDVLTVPIVALLAQPGGRFAVVTAAGNQRRKVPVRTGLFDEAQGVVEVTGVDEGVQVEVPVE